MHLVLENFVITPFDVLGNFNDNSIVFNKCKIHCNYILI